LVIWIEKRTEGSACILSTGEGATPDAKSVS
jgi:hypothetical protein